ncbi:hypothetical protein M3175_01645 [Robertmurraya korlensis]|uniref:hypothetical protein n=1 Tax=Robertmurraya korlensis TaxID=519977 RepID=UPI00203D745D|nr:hypothetical protein [Robertmurraya korlensis]MCM3599419.1 hypothetical protein [Robertmurraya korlensis]
MAKLIKNKSVSFNVLDPQQKKLFNHCELYENFSSYIKGLILRDMERESKTTLKVIEESKPLENEDFMSDLI